MKRLFLLFTALTLGLADVVQSQDIATLTGFPPLKNAVARQYTPDQSIYYCDDGENHYFVLYDINNPTTAIVSNFPSQYFIKDFEVFEDTVFFCGIYPQPSTPYGFVGQISVQDLFYLNNPYNIGTLLFLNIEPCPPTPYLATFDRMDVFRDGEFVHLAIVGELEHSVVYGGSLRRSAFDIWFDGTNWVGQALYDKDDLYKPCDITCTKDYVVVSAYDNNKNYSVLLVFDKISGFPSYPIAYNSFRINDRRYDDVILVERLKGNDVAVSHYFEDPSDGSYGTAVHYINDVQTLPSPTNYYSLHYVHSNTPPISVQRDLRFKEFEDISSLLLLHDIDAPLWNSPTSTVYDFDVYNLPSLTAQAWHSLDDVSLFSVDNRVQYPFFSLVGNHNPSFEPMLTLKKKNPENCYTPVIIDYKDISVEFTLGAFDDPIRTLIPNEDQQHHYPDPEEHFLENKCGESKTQNSHE